ncbi:MAG: hypothetical protein KGZ37_02705 [Nitrosarchaeum sp.]|nr:hypothetical protein [Nitrosarchaeum sp.]
MENITRTLASVHGTECLRYQTNSLPNTLKNLKNNAYSQNELKVLICRRYQLAHLFEQMLEYMLEQVKYKTKFWSKAKKEKFLFAIEQNILEEKGGVAEYGKAHIEGRKIILNALDVDYDQEYAKIGSFDNPTGIPAARRFFKKIKKLIDLGSIETLVVLWYYENRISLSDKLGDYWIMVRAFEEAFPKWKKSKYVEGDVFWHLYSHAVHDEFHAKYCEDALTLLSSRNSKKVQKVCEKMRVIFDEFWDSIDPKGGSQ